MSSEGSTPNGSAEGATYTPSAPKPADWRASSSSPKTQSPERSEPPPREAVPEPAEPQRLETEADRAQAISDLLAGRSGEDGAPPAEEAAGGAERAEDGRWADPAGDDPETPTGDPEPSEEVSAPRTLKELSEKLGVADEDLYNVELTTGDGEAVTLGELKDAWQDREAAERETAEKFDAIDERETALSADAHRLGMMVQDLVDVVGPERVGPLLEKQNEQYMRTRERERGMLMHVLPELRDAAKLDQFRDDLAETMGEYGVSRADIDRLMDHRLVWFARDAMRAMRKLRQLKAAPKPAPAPKPRIRNPQGSSGGRGGRGSLIAKARSGSEADKVRGISALLTGEG